MYDYMSMRGDDRMGDGGEGNGRSTSQSVNGLDTARPCGKLARLVFSGTSPASTAGQPLVLFAADLEITFGEEA